jgi:glycerol-3-phosphate acyltransferase PlsX
MRTSPVRPGRIAVDAMGGDHAPGRVVDGAVAAARQGVPVALVGRRSAIDEALAPHADAADLDLEIVEAAEVVGMDEAPAMALRRKPGASIRVAAALVKSGAAAAVVSAGHTGATVVAAHAVFGMLPGVDRPALAPAIPTRTGMAVLLDAGATVECRPQHLLQFGIMGAVYASALLGTAEPRVGVLSIGEEEGKGNELTREAYKLLKAAPVTFVGNVEARDVFSGVADVIVCDGFTGNVALKLSEGLVETVEELLGAELSSTFSSQMGYLLSRRAFRRFRKRLDYSEYGGAPLLGVSGLAFVCHGRSSAKAIRNAVVAASRFAADGVLQRVERRVSETLTRDR